MIRASVGPGSTPVPGVEEDFLGRLAGVETRSRVDRLTRSILGLRGSLEVTEEALHAAQRTATALEHELGACGNELRATREELARYRDFHRALGASWVWRLVQAVRTVVGRRW